eukprot:7956341-Alexandrium_andersonii.AAC.1
MYVGAAGFLDLLSTRTPEPTLQVTLIALSLSLWEHRWKQDGARLEGRQGGATIRWHAGQQRSTWARALLSGGVDEQDRT